MSGSDPRYWLIRLFYPFSKSVRKHLDRGWNNQVGTPPPWTAQGKRHAEAERQRANLLRSPPPLEGDARWMSLDEAKAFARQAIHEDRPCDYITLGYLPDDQSQKLIPVVSPPPGHILTIAATRAGKGASQIVPNLLTYAGSMLVIDPKGENYAMTHAHRRRFSRVLRIDPFRVTQGWDKEAAFSKFNPLDTLSDASSARRLATALLGEAPQGDNKFWYQEATNFLTGLLLYIVETAPTPTLGKLRNIMGQPEDRLLTYLNSGAESSEQAGVRTAFNRFIGKSEKERSIVLSEINASTAIWDEPAMSETVSASHIDFADLRSDYPITIYVVLPFDKLHSHSAFLKLVIAQFYQSMIVPAKVPEIPVICLIDEFPALGRMDELVKALGEIAGYGVRFWLFAQGVNQLKSIYPHDWETILAQCATQSCFGIADATTADLLSKQLGNRTIAYEVPGSSYSDGGQDADYLAQTNTSINASINFKGMPLASPNEIRRQLGVGRPLQVVFQSGHDPVMAGLLPWYRTEEMQAIVPDLRKMPVDATAGQRNTIPKRKRPSSPDEQDMLEAIERIEQQVGWKGVPEGHKFGIREVDDDKPI